MMLKIDKDSFHICINNLSTSPFPRCPVFLQWLDCVFQLILQFPCAFEFNEAFLVKLARHTYSSLFGTFLCNSERDRELEGVRQTTYSVWSFLRAGNNLFRYLIGKVGVKGVGGR